MTQQGTERQDASAWQADVQSLCAEFEKAIAALTADDLVALEAGLPVQSQLADRLQDLVRSGLPAPALAATPATRTLPEGWLPLMNTARLYSALLRRSQRSARLRAALCETYRHDSSLHRSETGAAAGLSWEV